MDYKKENKSQQPLGLIRYSCSALFVLFSFFYLYFIQGELLAEAQFVFSNGVTRYSILGGALIITIVLAVIQWVISKLVRFPQRFYALSFVPSFLILGMLTDMNSSVFDKFTLGAWIWAAPLVLIIYGVVIYLLNRNNHDNTLDLTVGSLVWPNYLILLIAILITGSVPRVKDSYLFELKMERLILDSDYDEALKVGEKSLSSSRRLTELRMYSLAMKDRLADEMFRYPQYYGVEGLLDVSDTVGHYRFDSRDIGRTLGAISGSSIKSTKDYLRIMVKRDTTNSKMLHDYYLCYKLLDKDLKSFRIDLPLFYEINDSLPLHYKEALMLKLGEDNFKEEVGDTALISKYDEYKKLGDSFPDAIQKRNKLRRKFGDTYWWYYTYSSQMSDDRYNNEQQKD